MKTHRPRSPLSHPDAPTWLAGHVGVGCGRRGRGAFGKGGGFCYVLPVERVFFRFWRTVAPA